VGLTIGGHAILDGVDLTIRRGEFVCVVGASGSGKTTMLRLIAGLLHATTGTLTYDGRPIANPRRDIAVVFQDYANALLPWRTAAGNVSLVLEAENVPAKERPARIDALLSRVGLAHCADQFPAQLSGGMQQRLQIARCLAQNPSVLLMDEPFGALDAMTRQSLQDELQTIIATTGATAFFVTHDLEEAVYLGDRVIGLSGKPGHVAFVRDVSIERPRDQLRTREDPAFVRLRHELFEFIRDAH
jgi:NitT/TauT family transport system ATP-binding protein